MYRNSQNIDLDPNIPLVRILWENRKALGLTCFDIIKYVIVNLEPTKNNLEPDKFTYLKTAEITLLHYIGMMLPNLFITVPGNFDNEVAYAYTIPTPEDISKLSETHMINGWNSTLGIIGHSFGNCFGLYQSKIRTNHEIDFEQLSLYSGAFASSLEKVLSNFDNEIFGYPMTKNMIAYIHNIITTIDIQNPIEFLTFYDFVNNLKSSGEFMLQDRFDLEELRPYFYKVDTLLVETYNKQPRNLEDLIKNA